MSESIATIPEKVPVSPETLEKVLLGGNLSVLSAVERMTYYQAVCTSVGLNPLTRPFEYLNLNGKLVLYARREATEQLRKIHGVSIGKLEKTFHGDDLYIVEAPASDKTGRTDSSTGAVNIKGLSGEAKANALMKCETKAKRRVTLSICGLGMLDETEVDSIPGAVRVPMPTASEPPDDVPAVDLRADEQEIMDLMMEIGRGGPPTQTPTLPPIATPEATERKKPPIQTRDDLFLAAMKTFADQNRDLYFKTLGSAGYERAGEVKGREKQKIVFALMQEAFGEGGAA